jgi:putative sterol carrier protein
LKLVISFDDWADLFAKRVDARKLLLTRKLRPKGNLRLFAKFGKIFP